MRKNYILPLSSFDPHLFLSVGDDMVTGRREGRGWSFAERPSFSSPPFIFPFFFFSPPWMVFPSSFCWSRRILDADSCGELGVLRVQFRELFLLPFFLLRFCPIPSRFAPIRVSREQEEGIDSENDQAEFAFLFSFFFFFFFSTPLLSFSLLETGTERCLWSV